MTTALETVLDYHEATKHCLEGYARGPGRMDWATQPDPFRSYHGARLISLEREAPDDEPSYADVLASDSGIPPAPLDFRSVSRLLYDGLSLSAWKSARGVSWPLRINPSSGNLHPTECYLLCGAVPGLCSGPMVSHYAPREHGLEVRVEIPMETWQKLCADLPEGAILLGLSSIHWRESWKYGERAYRYCQLDAGHALAALALAAAALGWQARLVEGLGSEQVGRLLGVTGQSGPEAEEPDCLVAVFPHRKAAGALALNEEAVPEFVGLSRQGIPNRLSPSHLPWDIIDQVALACRKPPHRPVYAPHPPHPAAPSFPVFNSPFRRLIRQRRSAVAMDGVSSMPAAAFYALLERTVSRQEIPPFSLIPWPPCIDLVLFVHRVNGLPPGLYLLNRNPLRLGELRELFDVEFLWERPASCPEGLDLFLLAAGDAREASMQVSCFQDIASEGCFSLAMLAEFARPLEEVGPWFYPRLYWECGMIGQVLYLEAEAAGLRGTGIGCFFDDPVHGLLGLKGSRYQDLYHFTVGGPVEDKRLATLPAYPCKE